MNSKTKTKLILDIIMLILLVLLYNSAVIGFHEIASLILIGLIIIHCLLNYKWIVNMSKKFLFKPLSIKQRFNYIINFLLLINFILLLLSGVAISKIVFKNILINPSSFWLTLHYFTGALSIILMGIHLGLHWAFIIKIVKKPLKKLTLIPVKAKNFVNLTLIMLILLIGFYNIINSCFLTWISEPFNNVGIISTNNTVAQSNSYFNYNNSSQKVEGKEKSPDRKRYRNQENTRCNRGNIVVSTVIPYGSIIAFIAVITYFIDKLMVRKKIKKE